MHDKMKIGTPILKVKNISRVLHFYQKELGLQVNNKKYDDDNSVYELGLENLPSSDTNISPLLTLRHDPDAKNASPNSAGLYHFAILVPDRRSLASTYLALKGSRVQYDGFADHLVSESIYLRDPESNSIEIYCDRPATKWPRDSAGNLMFDRLPLNLNALVSEINEEKTKSPIAFPTGARIGHMHLKVTNLERTIKFYHEKIGLDITVNWKSMGAAFLSAGGYHHHIGMNTWHSLDGENLSGKEAGLENFTITIPNRSSFETLRASIKRNYVNSQQQQTKQKVEENEFVVSDPDGIQIVIKTE